MKQFLLWLLLIVVALWSSACSLIGLATTRSRPTPTPPGDVIFFTIPAYAANLQPGSGVEGTGLTYVGRNGDAYDVAINGDRATKRTGDSFIWEGVLGRGVYGNYNLRITRSVFGALPVGGPVTLSVFEPQASAIDELPDTSGALKFSNIVVDYRVPVGRRVPGTTITYMGTTSGRCSQATTVQAEISGQDGFPCRARGDSVTWLGRLRDNVVLSYSLRTLSISEEEFRVSGTAELWVAADSFDE